jgi:hypothetical protein
MARPEVRRGLRDRLELERRPGESWRLAFHRILLRFILSSLRSEDLEAYEGVQHGFSHLTSHNACSYVQQRAFLSAFRFLAYRIGIAAFPSLLYYP